MVVPMVFVTTIWFATFLAVVLTTVYMVIPMGSRAVSCAFRGMSFGLYVVSPLVSIVPPNVICYQWYFLLFTCYSLLFLWYFLGARP